MFAEWIDQARYWISVLFVISVPPALTYWFVVHPFVRFWRRLGKSLSFWILGIFFVLASILLFFIRDDLLGTDLGGSLLLFFLALPLYAVTIAIVLERKKHLTFKILAGVPELSDVENQGKILDEGIYGRIRHPRYLEFLLGGTAWALMLDYSGVYWMMAATVVGILAIVPIEERELKDRFGQDYLDYCARVPRFIPRFEKGK